MQINQKILTELSQKLASELNPLKIYIFGSHAWGEPETYSDLDLLILVENSDEPKARQATRAYRALRDFSNIPIDILVRTIDEFQSLASIKSTLFHKIQNSGKLIYERQ